MYRLNERHPTVHLARTIAANLAAVASDGASWLAVALLLRGGSVGAREWVDLARLIDADAEIAARELERADLIERRADGAIALRPGVRARLLRDATAPRDRDAWRWR